MHYTSMAAVVKENFIRGHHSVVIAGTHGKTTTTSLMAWAMEKANCYPSFLIGGVAENFNASFRITPGKYFVIEGDEYDTAYFDKGPKFMHYLPDTVILNNIEFDHADIYRDLDAVKFAFSRLINLIPSQGQLLVGWDSRIVRELAPKAFCSVLSFGTEEGATWRATDIDFSGELTKFKVSVEGKEFGRYQSPLVGMFNVKNCLGVIAACEAIGLDTHQVKDSLAEFKSVKRRMQVIGVANGVTIIDDFAHHPTAVKETLLGAKQKYIGQRIIALFEPRSYTAQIKQFQQEFTDSLQEAHKIIIAGLFHPERYSKDKAICPNEMIEEMRSKGREADYLPTPEEIIRQLVPQLKRGDIVVVMSNGSFGGIHDKLLTALREMGEK